MIDSSPVRCLPSSCQIDRTSIRVRPEADVSFVPAFLPAKAKEKAVEEAGSDSSDQFRDWASSLVSHAAIPEEGD